LVPYPHGARLSASKRATLLCWPQAIKELRKLARFFRPLVLSFAGAKVQPFSLRATPF